MSKARSVTLEDEDWMADKKPALTAGSNLKRSGSVKDLIYRFDGPPPRLGSLKIKGQDASAQDSGKMTHESREIEKSQNPVSGEPSEPKTQEACEKNDDKHSSKECSKDKPDASDPGPVSGRASLVSDPSRLVPSAALLHCDTRESALLQSARDSPLISDTLDSR